MQVSGVIHVPSVGGRTAAHNKLRMKLDLLFLNLLRGVIVFVGLCQHGVLAMYREGWW